MTSRETREKSDVGERPYRGSIVISNLPNPKMAKLLEEFDLTGSGTVNFEEISYAAYLFRESKRYVKWGSVAIGVMCFLLTLVVITQSCFILYVVDSYQIADATDGALVDRKSGKPLQVGSSVFEVSDAGILQTKGGKSNVGVHADYDESKVSSNLSDEQLREMRRFDIRSSSGNYISMQVLSVARHSKHESKCGTVIVIYTFIGDMTIDGEQLTFNERVAGAFQNAGFAIAPSRRRLMGVINLIGFFDMLIATTDYAECPSTYNDLMVDGSWYTTTEVYKSCSQFSCLSTPYDNNEFPMIDADQVWPTNDASLAVINGKAAAKSRTFAWSEGVVDVDGEKFFKWTEYAYGEGVDNVFTSIEMKNFPGQRINEVRNKTHLFTYNSWDDNNMFCHIDKDVALQIRKENRAKMYEKFNAVQENSNYANADFSKTKEMVTIDGVVYNKWVYFNKMDNDGTLEQVMYESYSTGKPWKTELWMNGRLKSFSRYSFEVADGSSYGPSDLKMTRKCAFDKKDINSYSDEYYVPPFMMIGMTHTVKPEAEWLKPRPVENSRRRLQDAVCDGVTIPVPGGVKYTAYACPKGCCVTLDIKVGVAGASVVGQGKIEGDDVSAKISFGEFNVNEEKVKSGSTDWKKAFISAMGLPELSSKMTFDARKVSLAGDFNAEGHGEKSVTNLFGQWKTEFFVNSQVGMFGYGAGGFGWVMLDFKYFFNNKTPLEPGHYLSASLWFNAYVCLLDECILDVMDTSLVTPTHWANVEFTNPAHYQIIDGGGCTARDASVYKNGAEKYFKC